MKKDESPKINSVKDRGLKDDGKIQGQKSQPLKTFLGCDTCKLRNHIPLKKTKTLQENQGKAKKNVENNQNIKKTKIKLTDLCEEDKKRIVELMEELSKFAEKNRSLKESLDVSEKAKQEQHECLMKQTNLHLEEKNIFLKEIQTYKARLEEYENQMKDKVSKWESKERFMEDEIQYLAKALQKSFNEKSDLMKEISHLKTCLKQSLESFELLRDEVATLQRLSVKTQAKTVASSQNVAAHEKTDSQPRLEESADEYVSVTKENPTNKKGLDIINHTFEQFYALLQNKTLSSEKVDAPCISVTGSISPVLGDAKIPPKVSIETKDNITEATIVAEEKQQNTLIRNTSPHALGEVKTCESNYKFLKPLNMYGKTSVQAERILEKMGKPFSILGTSGKEYDSVKRGENQNEPARDSFPDFMRTMNDPFDEDRLLTELFYSDAMTDLGVESAVMLASREKLYHPDAN